MKRQILVFALGLLALCGLLTAARVLVFGIDYQRPVEVVGTPIVWMMTAVELVLAGLFWWGAWQYAAAYNSEPQHPRSFPKLSRYNAYVYAALGAAFLGMAICHWQQMYWSLSLVLWVVAVVLLARNLVWQRGMERLRTWFHLLKEAEGGDGERS